MNITNTENNLFLEEINQGVQVIREAAQIMVNAGILKKYQLVLAGGAPRELVMNKKEFIKDLDFLMTLHCGAFDNDRIINYFDEINWVTKTYLKEKAFNKHQIRDNKTKEIIEGFDQIEELKKIPGIDKNKIDQWLKKCCEFYQLKLDKNRDPAGNKYEFGGGGIDETTFFINFGGDLIIQLFNIILEVKLNEEKIVNYAGSSKELEEIYLAKDLTCVVKTQLNIGKQKMAIDLIFPKYSQESVSFVSNFDFNICKVFLEMTEKKSYKISDIKVTKEAKYDMENKRITYNFSSGGVIQEFIEKSVYRHYPRIKQKYPDFQLNFEGGEDNFTNLPSIFDNNGNYVDTNKLIQKLIDFDESIDLKNTINSLITKQDKVKQNKI